MIPLVSEEMMVGKSLFNPPLIECVEQVPRSKNIGNKYFLVTELQEFFSHFQTQNIITYLSVSEQTELSKQWNIVSIANEMFKGSQPMTGRELQVLKKTYKRLLSKTPTSFHK